MSVKLTLFIDPPSCNRINGTIKRNVRKQMSNETKLRIHNITTNQLSNVEERHWVLNKRDKQCLEAEQLRFLRPLLGYTKLDRQINVDMRERLKVQSIVEEIHTCQKNWKELCEISSSHGGEYDVQNCLLGCTAV
jgi:glutamate racemase